MLYEVITKIHAGKPGPRGPGPWSTKEDDVSKSPESLRPPASLIDRRMMLGSLAMTLIAGCSAGEAAQAPADWRTARLREIESAAGGRLGAHVFDL